MIERMLLEFETKERQGCCTAHPHTSIERGTGSGPELNFSVTLEALDRKNTCPIGLHSLTRYIMVNPTEAVITATSTASSTLSHGR